MSENQKTVIEINGVKMEIDLRHAKRIDHIAVGTRVKVLKKEYSDFKVHHGIVIGFEPFDKLPTIIIAFAKSDHSSAKVDFLYYNAATKDVEVVVASDDDLAALDKSDFIAKCDNEIAKKKLELQELEDRRNYFLEKFKCFWQPIEDAVRDATS